MKRLNLYTMDMKYVRDLAKVDGRVMSVSPQTGKQSRPFVGIVVVLENKSYCIPLSSPKPKHANMKNALDFSRIIDRHGKLIGVLNFNNMIPVNDRVIRRIDMRIRPSDDASTRHYKGLLNDQLDWCNEHADTIVRKANQIDSIEVAQSVVPLHAAHTHPLRYYLLDCQRKGALHARI